jgi:hypothetical protein
MKAARGPVIPLVVVLLFAFGTPCALFSDEDDGKDFLYPTLLNVAYDAESSYAGSVVILFEGIEGENAFYRIYRASTPLSSTRSPTSAELAAEVTIGQLPYRDVPREEGMYYYAVTAVLGDEEKLILVPYQNTTVSAVDFAPLPPAVETFEIRRQKETTVSIPFSPRAPENTYNLYVSGNPIESLSGLGAEETVADRDFFELTLKENTPYYFAITSQNRLGAENRALTPGENASADPFELEPAAGPAAKAAEKKSEPESPSPLEAKRVPKTPSPAADVDRVLRTRFYKGEYAEALEGFRSILARENLSPSEKSSVHFYMGQCEFYLGAYRNAIRYFILSKEDPKRKGPADAWIDRCLERVD